MTPKTYRRLKKTVIATTVMVLLGGSFIAYRVVARDRRIADARVTGLEAFAAGDYASALHHLGLFFQRNRDDVEVARNYALSRRHIPLPNGRHLIEALTVLRHVVEARPDDRLAAHELLTLYAGLGYDSETADLAERLLVDEPGDEATWSVYLEALIRLRRYDDLAAVATRLLDAGDATPAPVRHEAAFWRVRMLEDTDQIATALAESAVLVADAPAKTDAYVQHVRLMRRLQMPSRDVENAIRTWAAARPDDPALVALLAVILRDTGELAEARTLLASAADRVPRDVETMAFVLGSLDNCQAFALANAYLGRHAALLEERPDSLGTVLQRLLLTGRTDAVIELTREVTRYPEQAATWTLIQRGLALAGGETADELAVVQRTLESRPNDALAQNWLGVIGRWRTLAESEAAEALTVTLPAFSAQPADPLLATLRADAWLRVGETHKAEGLLQTAAAAAPWWSRPWTRLALIRQIGGRQSEVLTAAAKALDRSPGDLQAQELFFFAAASGAARLDETQRPLLEEITQAALVENPARDSAHLARIGARVALGDPAAVDAAVERYLADGNPGPEQLANVDRMLDGRDSPVRDAVRARLAASSATPATALAQAERGLADGDRSKAVAEFDARRAAGEATDPRGWAMARATLLERAQDSGAAAAWRELAEAYPDDQAVLRAALNASSVRPDLRLRRTLVNRLRAGLPEGALAGRVADATLRLDEQPTAAEMETLLDELRRLHRDAPQDAELTLLLARAEDQIGNSAQAIEHYRAAGRLNGQSVEASLRAAELLRQQGDGEAARSVAGALAARADSLRTAEAFEVAALLVDLDQREEARPLLQRLVSNERPDLRVRAARLLQRAGDPATAQSVLQEVLGDPTPAGRLSAANFYAASGDWVEADRILETLDADDLPEIDRRLRQARFYQAYGRHDEAAARLRAAAALPDASAAVALEGVRAELLRNDPAAARAALRAAVERYPTDPLVRALTPALRDDRLASDGLLRTGSVLLLSEAIRDADPEAATAALTLLGQGGQTAAETATALAALLKQYPGVAELHLLTASALEASGQREKAARTAARGLALFPGDTRLAQMAARGHVAQGDMQSALAAARVWRGNGSAEADRFIADILLRQGQPTLAADYLVAQVSGPGASPEADLLYARAMVAGGRTDAAARHLQPRLRESAAWRMQWLGLGAEISATDPVAAGRWIDGLIPYVDRNAAEEVEPLARLQGYLSGLTGDDSRLEVAAELLDGLPADRGGAARYETRGVIAELQAEPAVARESYEAALAIDPTRAMSANNLANLLVASGGDLERALALATTATASGASAEFADTLAAVNRARGDQRQALAAWENARRLEPDNPRWDLAVARAAMALEDRRMARTAAESAISKARRLPAAAAEPVQTEARSILNGTAQTP